MCSQGAIIRVSSGTVPALLPPAPPGGRLIVQFNGPLESGEHERLGALLAERPDTVLRAYDGPGMPDDLGFLAHYPCLAHLQIDLLRLKGLDGLAALPDTLSSLWIGETVSPAGSLRVLERFTGLEELGLDGHVRDIAAIGRLTGLRRLTLRRITLPDLSPLLPLRNLRDLEITLGGTRDLALLPEIGRLRRLDLYRVRKLSDLGFVSRLSELQWLGLQALGNVGALPSLAPLRRLRRVALETMKGITDFRPIAAAPALEELSLIDMKHLQSEHLRPLVGHPNLKAAVIGLGSFKRNAAGADLLGVSDRLRDPFEFV